MHPWPVFPPEVNYTTITSGAGPGPMVVHADAWATHAGLLEALVGASTVNAASLYGSNWQGAGAISAAAAHTGVNTETTALAAVAAAKVQPVLAAAEAHPTTVAMMVPAEQAVANRLEEAADEQINPWVLGALTPRIADLNSEYFGYMWPNNANRGAAYGAVLRASAAAIMAPSVPAISGASPAAPAAAAVAETAALSGVGAGLQAAEQGAMAVVSPAVGAPAAALGAVPLAASTMGTAAAVASAPAAQPLAAVQLRAPAVPTQAMAPAQAPVGMFAPAPQAATMVAPPAPDPALADSPAAQTLTPRPGPVAGPVPGPTGVTSFIRPAEPFAPPPPTAGRAAGLRPGMLNAAALRGPVTAAPATTTTSTLATATQPLAYVHPEPRPITPSQLPPLQTAEIVQAHQLQPQPTPPNNPSPPTQLLTPPPAPPEPASPPAEPQNGPPAPSTGAGGPGGGTGIQMLGSGPGGAPLAPQFPVPLDPQPAPPPPPPGNPPLRPAPIPSWASPPLPKSVEAAQKAYNELIKDIERHNSWRPDRNNWGAVQDYNQEAWYYNSLKAQLESQLDSSNVKYTPASQAVRMDIPSWTQPAPESPHPAPANHGPGTWEPVNESMSPRAAAYQTQITGHPFTDGYIVNGVKFDGFENGALIDAKGYYSQFIVDGEWQPWFTGQQAIINQALAQVRAAGGTPIRWVFAEPETAALVEQLFAGDPRLSGIIINVVFPK